MSQSGRPLPRCWTIRGRVPRHGQDQRDGARRGDVAADVLQHIRIAVPPRLTLALGEMEPACLPNWSAVYWGVMLQ